MTILPQSLRDKDNWALHIAKRPFDPKTLRLANSPECCASYEFVLDRLAHTSVYLDEKLHRFDGIGFQLVKPFAFVDLDHCRNPETGEIEPWARAVVAKLNSYSEISPSGTGLHIYLRTRQAPEGACRRGNIEIYTRSRFAVVTGQHLAGTPTDLEDRTDELLALHGEVFGPSEAAPVLLPASTTPSPLTDRELLGLAATAANGARFHQLYFGPVPSGDRSRLDFELNCKLMFWFGHDFDHVDQLFRASALMRAKWCRADYRLRTMRAAAARTTERYTPSQEVA